MVNIIFAPFRVLSRTRQWTYLFVLRLEQLVAAHANVIHWFTINRTNPQAAMTWPQLLLAVARLSHVFESSFRLTRRSDCK